MIQIDDNEYTNIDTIIYNKSVKDLDKVIESKNTIKSILISEKKELVKESVNIPLSSMMKIASNVFNEKYENISEQEKNELKNLFTLTKEETCTRKKSGYDDHQQTVRMKRTICG